MTVNLPANVVSGILETVAAPILVLRGEGRVEIANTAAITLFGRRGRQVIGMRLAELFPGVELFTNDRLERRLDAGPLCDEEVLWREGSRVLSHLRLSATRVPADDGGPPWLIAVLRDESLLFTTQEALRRTTDTHAARADRMASIGVLAAGVAHEINNPLSYVLGNIEFLATVIEEAGSNAIDAPKTKELVRALQEAKEGAERVRRIVRDLSTFARVQEDERNPVDVNATIEAALTMAGNQIERNALVVRELGNTPPVLASAGRLSQVFLNLLVNASQAIDAGHAESNTITVRTWRDGHDVCVEIKDTGRGIPATELERVFEPFFTTKPDGSGAGLGLSVCHNIVSSYGGTIEVKSELGRGTGFLIRMPAVVTPPAEKPTVDPTETRDAASRRLRVLIIDDEPKVVSVLRRMLARSHDVLSCQSGVEAKQLLAADSEFDLVLCDLIMPEITGSDIYRWVQAEAPAVASRMVFMTGGAFTEAARQFLDSVPNLWVEKPISLIALRQLVQYVVESDAAT